MMLMLHYWIGAAIVLTGWVVSSVMRRTWTVTKRTYSPRPSELTIEKIWLDNADERLIHGFTTIEERCDQTGRRRWTVVLGDQRVEP